MKIVTIIGGVAVTILFLAGCVIFSVAGIIYLCRYILPILAIALVLKLIYDFVTQKVLA